MKAIPLPSFLKRSPEQVAEETERQEKARAQHLKVRQTPAEARISRAVLAESTLRQNLADAEKGTAAYTEAKAQLAENLADQGKYAEAIKFAAGDVAKEYESIAAAMRRDDSETCNCPPQVHKNDRGGREVISPTFIAGQVYSEKHEKIVPLIVCGQCGHANAKI